MIAPKTLISVAWNDRAATESPTTLCIDRMLSIGTSSLTPWAARSPRGFEPQTSLR